MPSGKQRAFLRNSPRDQWWRKYGFAAYLVMNAAVVLIAPENLAQSSVLADLVKTIPAADSLMLASPNPSKVLAWILAGVATYPLFHVAMRSRLYARKFSARQLIKGGVSIALMDALLLAALTMEVGAIRARGVAGAWQRLLVSSDLGFAIAGPIISAVYSLAVFVSWYITLLAISAITREQ